MLDENGKYISNLISSAKQGNIKVYAQLVSIYIDNVYGLIYRIVYSEKEANSIVKEVFHFAWDNISQVRMNSSFLAWLQGIGLNIILTRFRQKKINSDDTSQSLKLSTFDSALIKLTFEERLLLVLHDIKKYSFEEIHDILPGNSIDNIQQLVYESRRKVAEGFSK